jgi:putative transposase
MFEDEASFGRISEPSYCWCPRGVRPIVPCQRVREYVYVFGASDPIDGEFFSIIAAKCNTDWMNTFLFELSKAYPKDYILMPCDQAGWHKSKGLNVPENIELIHIPPRTPEMNPQEQIWKEVRKHGFKNTLFKTLDKVIDKLCDVLPNISNSIVKSITGRGWISSMFNRK